jgi:polysaccharide biosynthesis transport protein
LSRNFELLQQVEKEQQVEPEQKPLEPPLSAPAIIPVDGSHARSGNSSLAREEEIKLVRRLFLSSPKTPRIVVFCGVEAGDGPGSICARASEALSAQVESPVCVVDASFRDPGLSQYFGVESQVGLTDALLNPGAVENFVQPTAKSNLWLLPWGSERSDRHAVLRPDRVQLHLADMRARFEYILVSTQPIHQSADAIALGQVSDGVVLVLEANSSRRDAAQRAKSNLQAANIRLLGAVLNNRTFPIPEPIYRKLQ